jgi:AcrR family transcriptional regulator
VTESRPSVWDRQRRAVRAEIVTAARELFVRQGFEATTIDEIVATVGVSRRTFFRYFGTKEDVLLGEVADRGDVVARALESRPSDEGPWEALRGALSDSQHDLLPPDAARAELEIGRIMHQTPSLRARYIEKRLHWHRALAPLIAKRIAGDDAELAAASIVATLMACLDVASDFWITSNGEADLADLCDRAVSAVRH